MKLSTVALTISSIIAVVADAVQSKVVTPAQRKSSALKAKGLDLAFQEHDKAYWNAVDEAVVARQYLTKVSEKIKAADKARDIASKALLKFTKAHA
jgi:sugar (pentulose or hexulose) kinase